MVERLAVNENVVGSSPTRGAKFDLQTGNSSSPLAATPMASPCPAGADEKGRKGGRITFERGIRLYFFKATLILGIILILLGIILYKFSTYCSGTQRR